MSRGVIQPSQQKLAEKLTILNDRGIGMFTISKRSIVGMTMYNQATQEIAKSSELLTSVRAYMTVLQFIKNYVTIGITQVFNNVLLQQTQHLDSHGEPTITSLYTNWYLETLLRQVSNGHIAYFPAMKAFVNLPTENELTFTAEEYSDISATDTRNEVSQ